MKKNLPQTQRTQSKIFFPLSRRPSGQRKSIVFPIGYFFLFFAPSAKNKKDVSLRSPRLCGENRVARDLYPYLLSYYAKKVNHAT